MKLQTLAVIFILIMLPVSMVMSKYIETQIDTLVLQTSYDSRLSNATYDAVKAYQLNELNSNTQDIYSEKIRDIEASVKAFYNSLGTNMGASGYEEEYLRPYIPALVYTLYDGYYIYGPYKNAKNVDENSNKIEYGLKPYIYYTCRYTGTNTDVTISYTLDNYITVYGVVKGNYETRSGYLIDYENVKNDGKKYLSCDIETENLKEIDRQKVIQGNKNETPYVYVTNSDGRRAKVYYGNYLDSNSSSGVTLGYYMYDVTGKAIKANYDALSMDDTSAQDYYREASEFSEWVYDNLRNLKPDEKVDDSIPNTNKVFDIKNSNPEASNSAFNEHKRNVIKNSIQTNLNSAIASFNDQSQGVGSTFNYKMPVLSETEWDKILNNVSIISFMQGLPIKNKYYMGYCVITNNKNKEFVDPKNIYFIEGDGPTSSYHRKNSNTANITGAYRNVDFERRKLITDAGQYRYYYPHPSTACYTCLVSESTLEEDDVENFNYTQKKWYYTALARERYNSYKVNNFGN